MKLYKTTKGILLDYNGQLSLIDEQWDTLVNHENLEEYLLSQLNSYKQIDAADQDEWLNNDTILAPIGTQEVWAAGVTYLRSRDARMEESESSATLYDKVYEADRPELFFKATPQRVSGTYKEVYIRKDSDWNVPEAELTLFISSGGIIQGYTIGNDMSSRSIEGENALYLPQAKIYEKCAGLGPCLYISATPISREAVISMVIKRDGEEVYSDSTTVSRMKRSLTELSGYLFRECEFTVGCYLMTGTCVVPPNDFTLSVGDVVELSIDGIGTLVNTIALNPKHKPINHEI